MALHLMKNEKMVWQSYPGVNYRRFILVRDVFLALSSSLLLYYVLVSFLNIDNNSIAIGSSLVVFVLWSLFAAINQINMLLVKYNLTTDRVIIQKGWLNKKMTSIKLENIVDTKVTQSFQERIINCGTIYIFTANDSQGNGGDENFLHNVPKFETIDSPFLLHTKISEVIDGDYKKEYE